MNDKEQPIAHIPLTKEQIEAAVEEALDIHHPNKFDNLMEFAEKDGFEPDMQDMKKINAALKKYEKMSIEELDKPEKGAKNWQDAVKKSRKEKDTVEKSR